MLLLYFVHMCGTTKQHDSYRAHCLQTKCRMPALSETAPMLVANGEPYVERDKCRKAKTKGI